MQRAHMRLGHLALASLMIGAVACAPAARTGGAGARQCVRDRETAIPADLNVRSLAGEYAMSLHLSGYSGASTQAWRLWLWPTSSTDSSRTYGVRAEPGDTASKPLYGTYVEDTSHASEIDERARRAGVDPVIPPVVLVYSGTNSSEPLLLSIGSGPNFREGTHIHDGAGRFLPITRLTPDGFRGTVTSAGIVILDTGYFCATRVH